MKAIQIKKHQVAAIEAIKNAVNNKQPKITIEMATGTGTSLILAKVLEYLLEIDKKKVLIITGSISIKEQLNSWIFEHYKDLINIDKRMVEIKNIQYVYKNPNVINDTYHFIITHIILLLHMIFLNQIGATRYYIRVKKQSLIFKSIRKSYFQRVILFLHIANKMQLKMVYFHLQYIQNYMILPLKVFVKDC